MSLLDLTLRLRRLTREREAAQWAAVLLAGVLFLSTTATGLAAGILLILFCFRGDFQKLRWHWRSPVVLSAAGLLILFPLGVLWSDASLADILDHLTQYLKFLFVPVLALVLARGKWPERALAAALASLLVLLGLSMLHFAVPGAPFWPDRELIPGVPFRTYTLMNVGCAVAAHALVLKARDGWQARRGAAMAMFALAAALVAHALFVAPSRTGVLVLLVLAALLCVQLYGRKGILVAAVSVGVIGAALYYGSPRIQDRFNQIRYEIEFSQQTGLETSSGVRWVLWKKGFAFIAERPVLGHGTGSVAMAYAQASNGTDRVEDIVTDDPHNQYLALMIPFGLAGLAALLFLWWSHLRVFDRPGYYPQVGQAMIAQCVTSALFSSSLYNFELGWFYIVVTGTLIAAIWRDERHAGRSGQERP